MIDTENIYSSTSATSLVRLLRLSCVTRTGGLNTYVEYDVSDNLTSIEHRDRSGIVSSFEYRFDGSNRITREIATITNYSFDALNRLEAIDTGGRLLLAVLYDADNNRVMSASRNPDPYTHTPDSLFFAALAADDESEEATRTADLSEDATGNHTPNIRAYEHDLFWYGVAQGMSNLSIMSTYLTNWLNSIWTLDFEASRYEFVSANARDTHAREMIDLLHIPSGVAVPNYEIDTERYTITRYINDTNRTYARTLSEYDEEGTWQRNFIYDSGIFGVNGVIAMNSTDTGHESFLTDGRGSVTEMITGSGNITTYSYDAFGNVRTSGDSANPFTYNQERFDFGVGLQYLRARYVDLSLGRFVSRDSVLGTLEDPRTHNLFLYVSNDPLNHIDPSGHVMIVGSRSSQTVHVWNNCPARCAQGWSIPSNRTSCQRCGRVRPNCNACNNGRALVPGGSVCRRCNRPAPFGPRTPRVTSTPQQRPREDLGQDRANSAIMAMWRAYFKNSNDTPARDYQRGGWAHGGWRSFTGRYFPVTLATTNITIEIIPNRGHPIISRPARTMTGVETTLQTFLGFFPVGSGIDLAMGRTVTLESFILSDLNPAVGPGGFVISYRLSQLTTAEMTYTAVARYFYQRRDIFPAEPVMPWGIVTRSHRQIVGIDMTGINDASIRHQLENRARARAMIDASDQWFRTAIAQRSSR